MEGDGDGVGGEGGDAAMIAEFADGDEGARRESRKDVGFAGLWRKQRNILESCVGGCDGSSIGEQDGDAWVG